MASINRRIFLRQSLATAVAGTTVIAATAAAKGQQLTQQARDIGDDAKNALSDRLDKLEDRIDNMEHHHRNLLKAGVFFMAVSTGVDLSLIL